MALALLSLFPFYNLYTDGQYTEDKAVKVATQFLKNSPTYSFDGMEDNIHVVSVDTISMPNTWSITIDFTSRNAGYGDRTGAMVATVVTDHTMVITASEGKITSAITDDTFDELTETMLNTPQTSQMEAEELALEWLRSAPTFSYDGINASMTIIDSVVAESYPEQYFISIGFDCAHAGYGNRTGMVLTQVITHHEAVVVMSSSQIRSAIIDDEWDELNQVMKNAPDIVSPEEAVSIVIQYLNENYPEAIFLTMTDEWTVANLTPEGLLGKSTLQYSGDDWTITESYPVVWKPVYSIQVENTAGFNWRGSVDQNETVTELSN